MIVSSRHYLVVTEDGAAENSGNKDIKKAETNQTIQKGADYFPWNMRLCLIQLINWESYWKLKEKLRKK